jgi:hypothetical protein
MGDTFGGHYLGVVEADFNRPPDQDGGHLVGMNNAWVDGPEVGDPVLVIDLECPCGFIGEMIEVQWDKRIGRAKRLGAGVLRT